MMKKSFKQLLWLAWMSLFTWTFIGHLFFAPTAYPLIKASIIALYPLVAWALANFIMFILRSIWRLLCLIDDALPI